MKKDIFKEVREEWGDYLETENKIEKEKFEIEKYDFGGLLNCYKEWRGKGTNEGVLDSYDFATELFKKYELPYLSEDKIDEFIEEVEEKKYWYNGIFFSAVINELYKNGEIHLNSNSINFIGCCDWDKKIIVKGDCKNTLGYNMKCGEIVVEGDCGDWIGVYMTGGEIVVEGDCGYGTGFGMAGGEIKIYGDNFDPRKQISGFAEKGEIYHKDKLVWKDGELLV